MPKSVGLVTALLGSAFQADGTPQLLGGLATGADIGVMPDSEIDVWEEFALVIREGGCISEFRLRKSRDSGCGW